MRSARPTVPTTAAFVLALSLLGQQAHAASADWPNYMFDRNHGGFNRHETTITPANASTLTVDWSVNEGSRMFAQPVTGNGLVYWGTFDGFEHASDPQDGTAVWSTLLGTTSDPVHCRTDAVFGVTSTPALSTVTLAGIPTKVLFVAGGDAAMYALNALTGAVIWRTSLGTSPSHFVWDSPVVYKGNVYVGVSSLLDCPVVPGRMFKLSATTGAVEATLDVMPGGCTGGGIWGSPVVDATRDTLYVATGNPNENVACPQPVELAPALLELRTSDLSLVGSWQVPEAEQIVDSDFGSTPNLFVTAEGVPMVGVANKNGFYYAFRRDALDTGPVWKDAVADGTVPLLAPAAVGYASLLVASSHTTIKGVSCNGSLRGVDPASGAYRWELCLTNGVQGAVSMAPGIVVLGVGPRLVVVSTSGKVLYRFFDPAAGSVFKGAASVAAGHIYMGNSDGIFYAFAPPAASPTGGRGAETRSNMRDLRRAGRHQ
ncbi:MAG: PQQ-binding-like beta-propeller repeat protein [Actinomycetota bacterium]|nr:PQQ-binding-like beta-propeller repeat protein [Actinomycetota bacterium]